ncbi:myosin heavy chain kinase B-like [Olea europaea subsp. europaea]|uniref:Myosin heavy chain kinase B-like n=1 Tax=Olea europaea subsp. europaea TaxID=158383 RepID=A0A8S0PZP6_OLEEU|nr:myosin heavy chain kinase B-like [Olea europaea subsp. europaea]
MVSLYIYKPKSCSSIPFLLTMEYYGKRNLYSFIEEETRANQSSPPHLSFKSHRQISDYDHDRDYDHDHDHVPYSPSMSSSTPNVNMYTLMPSPSLDSPWTLSPLQTPSPSLLHHCIASLHRQEGNIFSIAVSRGLIFTGSESCLIRAWRQPDCPERGYLRASYGDVRAILAHGNILFTSHRDNKVRRWNINVAENFQAKKVITLPKRRSSFLIFPKTNTQKHKDCISCMAYFHAEGLLYTGSWDKTVKAWRVSDNRSVDSFVAHDDCVNAIVVNQEDGCVFSCSSDGSVKIWRRVYDQSSHTLTMTLKFQPSPVNALALITSLNSCFLYSGSSDGLINFWEKEKMSSRYNHGGFLQGHRFAVLCLVAIEKLIFSGSEDTTIRVWRREEGSCFHECLAVIDAHRGPVRCLAASVETEKLVVMGFLVYSAGLDQTFKGWRVKVLPEEKKGGYIEDVEAMYTNIKISEYEMSPVLSPSWVGKKLQGNYPVH